MATQYTSILKLALPVQGELSGTWGDVVNDNITSMVEEAIAGRAVIDSWTANSHTLTTANGTTSESRCAMLEFTDTGVALTGAGTVVCPTQTKIYIAKNDSGQAITVKTAAGTGIAVQDGETKFVFCDGTNVVEAVTSMTTLKVGTGVQVSTILDEDNMASDSATALATQQSIKAYVDAQVTAQDLDFAGDSGTGAVDLDSQSLTVAGTANEIETSASGQTLTVGLPSAIIVTTSVTTPTVQTTNLNANDGTAAATIADSTGVMTVNSAVLTTADINGGTADNVVIGGTTAAAGSFTTVDATGNITSQGQVITDTINEQTATSGVTVDGVLLKDGGATLTGDLTVDTDTLYVDSTNNEVGIGTTAPNGKLEIAETDSVTYSSSVVQGDLIVSRKNTDNTVNEVVGLEFDVTGWSGVTTGVAGISAIQTGANASSAALAFQTRGSGTIAEAMRIDSSQRVLIGNNAAIAVGGVTSRLQVLGDDFNNSSAAFINYANNTDPAISTFGKSRSGTTGSAGTIVQNNDVVGNINWSADDGTDLNSTLARISGQIDGTPGLNDMPGRLMFYTTADGAASVTERMRIDNAGRVGIGTDAISGYNAYGDGLVVKKSSISGSSGMTVQAPDNAGYSSVYFGRPNDTKVGGLEYSHSLDGMFLISGNSTAMVLDSSQRVLIGTTSSRETSGGTRQFQIEGTTGVTSSMSITRNTNADTAPSITLAKTRGAAVGSDTSVIDGDTIGQIVFAAADGTDANSRVAEIEAFVDGTVGSNDTPGRLVFSTTADGAASTTERMRIGNDGKIIINSGDISTGSGTNKGQLQVGMNEGSGYYWTDINTGANQYASMPNEIAVLNTPNSQLNSYAGIFFQPGETSNGATISAARIGAVREATGNIDTALVFANRNGSSMAEAMRIDSSRRVLIGHTSSPTDIWGGQQNSLQVIGTSWGGSGLGLHNYNNSTTAPNISFSKSRSGTVGTSGTIVQNGDYLGFMNFSGDDGTDLNSGGAQIYVQVDGTPGVDDMPGRIVFTTTADGASSPTERWRITNDGNFIGNGGYISFNTWQSQDIQGTSGTSLNYWKLGTWSNVGGGDSCHIELFSTTSYSNGSGPAGTTVIDLRRDNSSVDDGSLEGTFYSRTAGATPAITSVYYKPIDSRTGFEIYVKAGSFAQIDPFIKVTGGSKFAVDTADTGSTSPPSGSYNGSIYSTSYFYQGASGDNSTWPSRVGFRSNGNVVIESGSGIEFADAGGSGTSTSNTLDSYEEGTWTPVLQGSTTAGTYTYAGQSGAYIKVGNIVTASFRIVSITTSTAGTGYIQIAGLPFAKAANNLLHQGPVRLQSFDWDGTLYTYGVLEFIAGSSVDEVYVRLNGDNDPGQDLQISHLVSGSSAMYGQVTYFV